MKEADQLIAGALRDITAEAGLPGPDADAAWRAGRRRRLAALAASAASVAGVITLALTVVLPLAAPGPASLDGPPAGLVSITLSPVAPARTDVLAAAARILRDRAALLHLPSTQARVSGPDVVLTGPAADESQLRALVATGVLTVRQVLLYEPYYGSVGGRPYGHASLVNHSTLTRFSALVCTPGDLSGWPGRAGYAAAAAYDDPDAQIVSCDRSGGKYVLDVATVRGAQVSGATAGRSATSNQWEVKLTLNRAGAAALDTLTSHMYNAYYAAAQGDNQDDLWLDTIAFVLDTNVISAPEIAGPIQAATVQIAGNFTRTQAEDLAAQLQSGPLPVGFRVSAGSARTTTGGNGPAGT